MHHIWGETVQFIIQTSDRMQYFTICQDKFHSVNIQGDQSWAFSENVQKISKITKSTASRFSHLTSAKFAVNINRVTLQHNKEFIMLIFLFNGFITMCNLKKRLIRAAFWVLLHAMFMNDWKQLNGTAIKIARETTNNQQKKYNSVKHLQRQQFSFHLDDRYK